MTEHDQADEHREEMLTFVTVTYRAEDVLQLIQARSFARYAPRKIVARIIVLDNGRPLLSSRRKRRLIESYGDLADLVEVVPAIEVSMLPESSGWMGQQVLKLAISRLVTTRLYVLLDAKNHLIRDVTTSDFVGPDGRARGGFHSYASHPLLPRLRTTLDYLQIGDSIDVTRFPVTSTPFVMHTDVAKGVIADVGSRSHRSFAEEFVANDLSEFFLYSGWLARSDPNWNGTYDGVPIQAPTVWGRQASVAGASEAIQLTTDLQAGFFGVHRRALRRMDRSAKRLVEKFWRERELIADSNDFRHLMLSFTRDYATTVSRARLTRWHGRRLR